MAEVRIATAGEGPIRFVNADNLLTIAKVANVTTDKFFYILRNYLLLAGKGLIQITTQEEFDRINIQDNLLFGQFDFDILGNKFDMEQLTDWGMPETWMPAFEVETIYDKKPKCPKCGYVILEDNG